MIANQAQGLLPLGLLAWMAFTISFALPKLSYILGVLNDPFGWGWHLLGASTHQGNLDVSRFSLLLQIVPADGGCGLVSPGDQETVASGWEEKLSTQLSRYWHFTWCMLVHSYGCW